MRLKVLVPTGVLVDQEVHRVGLQAADGEMTLLDNHLDLTTALVPGVMSFELTEGGAEGFVALTEGVLVKVGEEVLVSTRRAVRGDQLGQLEQKVREEFRNLDQREESSRTALAKIEATMVNRFIEMQHGYK